MDAEFDRSHTPGTCKSRHGPPWPCQLSRALTALDALTTERNGWGDTAQEYLARADAAEAQVAALVEAAEAVRMTSDTMLLMTRIDSFHAIASDLSAAAAEHDARVAREAVAAFIASERASQKLSADPDHD
jgi:hypothetical protein